jgi:hypothetical protein
MDYFYIIYPGGDKSCLSILETCSDMLYELDEYALASRRQFTDKDEAIKYLFELAEIHKLNTSIDKNKYLD